MNDTRRDVLACIINLLWSLGLGIACIIGIFSFLHIFIYITDLPYYINFALREIGSAIIGSHHNIIFNHINGYIENNYANNK